MTITHARARNNMVVDYSILKILTDSFFRKKKNIDLFISGQYWNANYPIKHQYLWLYSINWRYLYGGNLNFWDSDYKSLFPSIPTLQYCILFLDTNCGNWHQRNARDSELSFITALYVGFIFYELVFSLSLSLVNDYCYPETKYNTIAICINNGNDKNDKLLTNYKRLKFIIGFKRESDLDFNHFFTSWIG